MPTCQSWYQAGKRKDGLYQLDFLGGSFIAYCYNMDLRIPLAKKPLDFLQLYEPAWSQYGNTLIVWDKVRLIIEKDQLQLKRDDVTFANFHDIDGSAIDTRFEADATAITGIKVTHVFRLGNVRITTGL